MASTSAAVPSSLHSSNGSTIAQNDVSVSSPHRRLSTNNLSSPNHLSPFSAHAQGATTSPTLNNTDTPADSISSLSHYHTSDFSDFDDPDPFFGVDFNAEGGTPSFMDESLLPISRTSSFGDSLSQAAQAQGSSIITTAAAASSDRNAWPLSPDQTASIHTASPASEHRIFQRQLRQDSLPNSVSPQDLQKPFKTHSFPIQTSINPALQLTPDPSRSGRSSEDDPAQGRPSMPGQSPRVTVSLWGKDDSQQPIHSKERIFCPDEDSAQHLVGGGGINAAGDLIYSHNQSSEMPPPPPPKDDVPRRRTASFSRRGLEPGDRTATEVESVNEMTKGREIEERNQVVDQWLTGNIVQSPPPEPPHPAVAALENPSPSGDDGIALGNNTENKFLHDQIYILPHGQLGQADVEMLQGNRLGNAPTTHPILQGSKRFQPESSNAAIAEFNRRCHDNESIVSKAATWGTRRRSLPSLADLDSDGVTSGRLLKKLTIRGDGGRRPSLLQDLRGLVRRPSASQLMKRGRSQHEDDEDETAETAVPEKRETFPTTLAPPPRSGSWGTKKQPVPSINTALVSVGRGAAAIGSTHTRTGSISATSKSPKSPMGGLQVRNTLQRRPRSKSDLPKGNSYSNLADMWRKTGGPPVATLGTAVPADQEDDDDEEDDMEDSDMKTEASKLIDDILPTYEGFYQHILRLNPSLEQSSSFLLERIAHQQLIRYKHLLTLKLKHLNAGANCHCGSLCIAQGGSANMLDPKGDPRGAESVFSRLGSEDGDRTPSDGTVTAESFPQDIPMPPTQSLPAELECQLCFSAKKFTKPSDWTKHVHEDVQPFTCTWDGCREPKIFKRKADWVRHENEGHRHLEWWTCDVDDCRHTCYRRDNFLQHLVREHKFAEPKVKTKAALKRAGGGDATWQRVENCHVETPQRPSEEPCRFCGKSFPSWKKLTVHLAKHMEQISLPVLRLVARKELDPDTIISPVQDPPPRTVFPSSSGNPAMGMSGGTGQDFFSYPNSATTYGPQIVPSQAGYGQPGSTSFGYSPRSATTRTSDYQDSAFHTAAFGVHDTRRSMESSPMSARPLPTVYTNAQSYASMPASAASYQGDGHQYSMGVPTTTGLEPFPAFDHDALGLQHNNAAGPVGMNDQSMSFDMLMPQAHGNTNATHYAPQGSAPPYRRSSQQSGSGAYARNFYTHQ